VELNYQGYKATVKTKGRAGDGSDIDAILECTYVVNPINLAESLNN
jgi:hypothetical protein